MQTPSDLGLQLRIQALAQLQQAHEADGLKPYGVTYCDGGGSSVYLLWSNEVPSKAQAETVLDCAFEPELDETLEVSGDLTLEEITGVAVTARLADIEASLEA